MSKKRSYEVIDLSSDILVEPLLENRGIVPAVTLDPVDESLMESESTSTKCCNGEKLCDACEASLTLECKCCFSDYPLSEITQCIDGHLFCLQCARLAAQQLIGLSKTDLKCISSEEPCEFMFHIAEIERFLPEKEFKAYQILGKEIGAAGIEGLIGCPFCAYAEIMTPEDVLFRCANEPDCGVTSCIKCKKKDHSPSMCEEEVVTTSNLIAEAMTSALTRECPGCKAKFFKSEGCNKMTCVCGKQMCYVCRVEIKDYQHFGTGGCALHDDTGARNLREATEAGEKKMKELGILDTENAKKLLDVNTFKNLTATRPIPNLNNHHNNRYHHRNHNRHIPAQPPPIDREEMARQLEIQMQVRRAGAIERQAELVLMHDAIRRRTASASQTRGMAIERARLRGAPYVTESHVANENPNDRIPKRRLFLPSSKTIDPGGPSNSRADPIEVIDNRGPKQTAPIEVIDIDESYSTPKGKSKRRFVTPESKEIVDVGWPLASRVTPKIKPSSHTSPIEVIDIGCPPLSSFVTPKGTKKPALASTYSRAILSRRKIKGKKDDVIIL